MKDLHWGIVLTLTYFVSTICNQSLLLVNHEVCHDSFFKTRKMNLLMGLFAGLPTMVLRIFFKILVMRANFGDFGILISTSKFWKNLVRIVTPYWDQFWKILTIEFWWNRKVMINHRGGILIFGQILSKSKILDFRVKDFKFCEIFVKFWILGLRFSNLQFS